MRTPRLARGVRMGAGCVNAAHICDGLRCLTVAPLPDCRPPA